MLLQNFAGTFTIQYSSDMIWLSRLLFATFIAQIISETLFHRNWVKWFSNFNVSIIDIYSTVSPFRTLYIA